MESKNRLENGSRWLAALGLLLAFGAVQAADGDPVASAEAVAQEAATAVAQGVETAAAVQEEAVAQEPEAWVYVGEYDSDAGFVRAYFDLSAMPESGETLTATGDVNLRAHPPEEESGWTLGTVVGAIRKGERFAVVEVRSSWPDQNPDHVWVRGRVIP